MVKRIVILTGTNRGLGHRTAQILLEKYSADTHYIFTQRSKDSTELTAAFKKINPNASFEIQPLEITDKASRTNFITWLSATHKKADAIFNNAGVYNHDDNGKGPLKKIAEVTLDINFTSTVEFTEEILPYLTDDAKIMEVSSLLGQIEKQPQAARHLLQDPTLTKERLYQFRDDYISRADDPTQDLVFGNISYFISKALLTAYVRFVAQKLIKPTQSIFSVHPGWVQTDMGGPNAPLTMDQSCPHLAETIAVLPYGRHPLNGMLIFENKQIDY